SSHNTLDVEQISDQITFIDRGRIVASLDKESFLDRWRRLEVDVAGDVCLENLPGMVAVSRSGQAATLTTNDFTPELPAVCEAAGAAVRDVRRMTLEEIFVANVLHSRKERGQ
ncbi:MAG: ABC transporter ATP-binding protein, partial [Gammaproteobacteria bacterium]|nr:ABC transporter ATP-binding protein [Gammaproteobacteria bacterium]